MFRITHTALYGWVALLALVAAIAAPGASARLVADNPSPHSTSANAHGAPDGVLHLRRDGKLAQTVTLTTYGPAESDSFDWTAAGIGVAVGLGAAALAATALVLARRRQHPLAA